jgi:hypothetical protein
MPHGIQPRVTAVLLLAFFVSGCAGPHDDEVPWRKGNLHTHSLWSDGDDFPEMIVEWYKTNGYDFIALSDHNKLAEGEQWVSARDLQPGALAEYLDRFGSEWVNLRVQEGDTLVRLKTLAEYRPLLEEEGRYVIIQSEEITDRFGAKPIHVNATNLKKAIVPQGGNSVLEVMQRNVDAVLEQRRRTGRPMFPHINHPNFQWAVTADDLAALKGERFFEVYNGHPAVHNEGDSTRMSTDRMWDVILTERLLHGREIMYGLAVDDAHHYHGRAPDLANSGRGWIQVRSKSLVADSLIAAMERGDFYASTGIEIADIKLTRYALSITLDAEPGITYTTEFIGTRMPGAESDNDDGDAQQRSIQVGALLDKVEGSSASYTFTGDELYVRARVVSDKQKENGQPEGELEVAWTQPVLP